MLQRGNCVGASAQSSLSASDGNAGRLLESTSSMPPAHSRNAVSGQQVDAFEAVTHRADKLLLEKSVRGLVGSHLRSIEKTMRQVCSSRFDEVKHLCDHVESLGGKRLRPILVVLSAEACKVAASHLNPRSNIQDSSSSRDLTYIGAAIELVHAASLVHDDIMDQAATRRHLPTVGAVAGDHAAILLGDFLFTKAYDLAARCQSRYPARRLSKAASALCEGELRQQLSAGNWHISTQEYLGLLSQKTGSLCAVSCRLGAFVSGIETSFGYSRRLSRFGLNLGLAFQLFDDWLDYWGNERTGKTLGTDLAQCKPTLPLLRLLTVGSQSTRRELIRRLQTSPSSDESREYIRAMLDASDASEYTLQMARQYVQNAITCLDDLPDCEPKSCLQQIARFSASRLC